MGIFSIVFWRLLFVNTMETWTNTNRMCWLIHFCTMVLYGFDEMNTSCASFDQCLYYIFIRFSRNVRVFWTKDMVFKLVINWKWIVEITLRLYIWAVYARVEVSKSLWIFEKKRIFCINCMQIFVLYMAYIAYILWIFREYCSFLCVCVNIYETYIQILKNP